MGINTTILPSSAPVVTMAYNVAIDLVNTDLACGPVYVYELAVYNLAGSNLINFAHDTPPSTYFTDIRKQWNMSGFVSGIIQSASDVSTSESMVVPDFIKELTLADLQYTKDPYGRQYLAFAQRYGTLWGLS